MAVYKRGDKAVFYMNFTVDGVRVSRSTGKFTKKEAKLVEAVEKKRMMVDGALSPRERAARMLLSIAIQKTYDERWKDNKDGLKAKRLAERALELVGDIPLCKIEDQTIKRMVKKLEDSGVKGATINRYLATMKTLLRHHQQPWEHIKLKKESKGRIRVLSKEEETTVVSLLRDTDHPKKRSHYPEAADLIEVLVDTGCRLSEVLNLKYEDINWDTNLISIWINKGDKPRSIPMTKRVRGTLLARQEGDRIKPFSIDIDQAQKAWNWARKRMMLDDDKEFVMHALRHTCATRLLDRGIDLYTVKEWLGHSTMQVTERYAHLRPEKLVHAVAALDL
ncbi:site-specific integrase [Geomonas subterranea]|uniref:Site-specific integrase n=1 Tax=Geomonas subterranea TaxID=2847989 RepID=A0ABX8LL25_9BACT|nr:site-specific integrase [Geomonas subterranea]QXE92413.1 site-specific integrase [Geomonas subterranea]QXM09488.1 site-specific integrase [Geomonas subterranea]